MEGALGYVVVHVRNAVKRRPEACALVYLHALPSSSAIPSRNVASDLTGNLQRWTYREVWRAARTLARALLLRCPTDAQTRHTTGEQHELRRKVVGVMVDEGPLLPLVELAVLLADMVVVPLDAGDPRVRFVIEDAAPRLIVAKDPGTARVALEAVRATNLHGTPSAPLVLTVAPAVAGAVVEPGAALVLRPAAAELDGDRRRATTNESKDEVWGSEEELFALTTPASSPTDAVSHIFFTSGSTGRPKGCVVAHAALLSYCQAKSQVHRVDESSVCFVASALTFDPSLGDFFSTWCSGGTVALAPRSLTFSSLGACLSATQATHLLTTPSLFNTIPRPPPQQPSSDYWLSTLRVVALGGEPMPREMMETWSASESVHLSVINTYGVTECCVYQTAAFLRPDSPTPKLLGDPLPGNRIVVMRRVADADAANTASADDWADMQPVEEGSGEEGELWIAGDQVGLGYFNMPELTARKFIVHPIYGRCFRTGDLVEAFPSGVRGWKLIGRSDGQVKISGQRVELGEIEEALLSASAPHLLHSAAVVIASGSAHGHRTEGQLVAYCVPSPSPSAATSAEHELLSELLRFLCEERLPRHMIPSRFIFVESLPTTRTGKIARALLTKQDLPPLHFTSAPASSFTAAWGEREESDGQDDQWRDLVAVTWSQVLGLEGLVLAHSNAHFVELGGDSLAALRVCQAIARQINEAKQGTGSAADMTKTAKTKPSAKPTTVDEKSSDAKASPGEFGELLGPLAPMELLKRPRLWDFARHLRESFGNEQDLKRATSASATLGAEQQSRDAEVLRLLYRAAGVGADSIVRFLLDHRRLHPDGRQLTSGGVTTASKAAPRGLSRSAAASGGSSSTRATAATAPAPRRYLTPLHVACANGHASVVLTLLAKGASPTIADPSGVQPIHLAAQKGPVEMLDALLISSSSTATKKAKPSVNAGILLAKDDNLQTVLHHAARADAPGKVMDHLLEKWVAMSATLGTKATSTTVPSAKGGRSTATSTRGGASGSGGGGVDCVDRWLRTPLHWAVVNGHRTMVAKLLECGADRKRVDDKGETPLAIAERRARCGAKERPEGMGASVFGDIAKLLGGSGSTKRVSTYV